MEVIEQLADYALVKLAQDLAKQLDKRDGTRPLLHVLAVMRVKAAKAVDLFIDVDPVDTDAVRRLQAELRVYNDFVEACRDMMALGKEAGSRINEEEREQLEEVIQAMTDDERRLYQYEPRSRD